MEHHEKRSNELYGSILFNDKASYKAYISNDCIIFMWSV